MTDLTKYGLKLPDPSARIEKTLADMRDNFNVIDDNLVRFGSSYDLFFNLFEATRGFQQVFYDDFVATNSAYAKSPTLGHNDVLGAYESTVAQDYLTINPVHASAKTLYGFYLNVDTHGDTDNFVFQYSADSGPWVNCVNGLVNIPAGFTELVIRIRFTAAFVRAYSIAVLFDQLQVVQYGDNLLSENYTATGTLAANTVITVPNSARFVANGKSLRLYWNATGATATKFLINGIDYVEVDTSTIRLLKTLTGPGVLSFRSELGISRLEAANLHWVAEAGAVTYATARILRVARDITGNDLERRGVRIIGADGSVVYSHILNTYKPSFASYTEVTLTSDNTITNPVRIEYGMATATAPLAENVVINLNRAPTGQDRAPIGSVLIVPNTNPLQARTFVSVSNTNETIWQELLTSGTFGQVDNTRDADKPVSGPQQAALDLKENKLPAGGAGHYLRGDRTFVTLDKVAVGLANVDNTSDANKPISTQVAAALAGKEPSLGTGTTAQYLRGDRTWQTHDKVSVGLANVDNTSDANKPISTATQTALNLKLNASLYTAADVLAKLLTVDGPGSGLDADTLDGLSSAQFLRADASVTMTSTLDFGSATRQMINLYTTSYGIGVQSGTLYVRTGSGFSVHTGGAHSGSANDAGTGGTNLMSVTPTSFTYRGNAVYHAGAKPTKADVGLGSADNTSDADKPLSIATVTALAGKEPVIAAGTTSQYYRGDKSWQVLNAAAVGLGNVNNTSDAAKPISTATQTALNAKEPTVTAGLTSQYYRGDKTWATHDKASVGLANVDNTSDANKPISTAAQAALDAKEALVAGGLTSQYYRGDKTWQTLNKAAVGLGNVDNTTDLAKPISTATQTALNAREPSIAAGTTAQYWRGDKTWQALDRTVVGLGNVDNTSDASKPVSTAQATALALKAPINSPTFTGAVTLAQDPTSGLQAATKQYVDNNSGSINFKSAVQLSTTANITLSGEQTIDGVLTNASRVLVKAQTNPAQNGVYVTGSGAWTRATDLDDWSEIKGAFVYVSDGVSLKNSSWSVIGAPVQGTIGTTAINWGQFSGSISYTAAGGINLANGQFSLSAMSANTLKGNNTAGTAAPTDLSVTQVRAMLSLNNVSNTSDAAKPISTAAQAALDTKEPVIAAGTTSQYYRGDKTFVTLDRAAVGLANVDNTSDANKPISNATQTALNTKEPVITAAATTTYYRGDKTFVTLDRAAVGLANVDNTSDLAKPVSTATAASIATREPAISAGATSQYWRGDKTWQTLNSVAVGLGNVDNTSDANKPISTATAAALAAKEPTLVAGTTSQFLRGDKTWVSLTKAMVGLSNVDNTTDANKPISTATAAALALKANASGAVLTDNPVVDADPTTALGIATKQYVDALATGLVSHPSVALTTVANITLSGEQTIDGITTSNSRILVKNQNNAAQNGIYVTGTTAWTRAADMDDWSEVRAAFVFVTGGTTQKNSGWSVSAPSTGTLGTTAMTWNQFSASGNYTASGGVQLNVADFSLAPMPANTLKGNNTAGSAVPVNLTVAQTRAMLALDQVSNTSDANKPISTATAAALDAREPSIAAGTSAQYWTGTKTWATLNKAAVGLANVDNTSDANKPVSTATQAALDAKESSLGTGTTGQFLRGDKTWQAVTKANVGLGSVDNTSDAAKPVSTAQAAALALKADLNSAALTGSPTVASNPTLNLGIAPKQYVDSMAVGLIPHTNVDLATTGNISLSGEKTIDGVMTNASRVLVKDQTLLRLNGIYVTGTGAWTRAVDADSWDDLRAAFVFVTGGVKNANSGWTTVWQPGGTIDTTQIVWSIVSNNAVYTAAADGSLSINNLNEIRIAQVQNNRLMGNVSGGNASPTALTPSEARTLLNLDQVNNTPDVSKPISTATQSALDAKENSLGTGTTGQYLRGDRTWATHDRASVGLGNVDNTSDLAKPISTATQTALNLKLNASAYTAADVLAKLLTVDGAGSGVDADLLDGNQAAWYQQAIANISTLALGQNTGAGAQSLNFHAQASATTVNASIVRASGANGDLTITNAGSGAFAIVNGAGAFTYNGNAVYHAGAKPSKADVGLGSVDNTSDANKPVSTAQQTALDTKEPVIAAGTALQYWRGDKTWQTLNKASVGLANVDNTSDAAKPLSTAATTALAAKEPTITGGTTAQYWRGDKTWQTLNKAAVGLSNVDNTSDTNKPVSTATAAALDLKLDASAYTVADVVSKITGQTLDLGDGTRFTGAGGVKFRAARSGALHGFTLRATGTSLQIKTTASGDPDGGLLLGLNVLSINADVETFTSAYQIYSGAGLSTAGPVTGAAGTFSSLSVGNNAVYHRGDKPTKSDVGLDQVDNTSDLAKPISTAVNAELAKKLNLNSYTAADVLAKLLTVDGAGSGVDADLLDGLNSDAFYRTTASFTTSGNLTIQNGAPQIMLSDTDQPDKWRMITNGPTFHIQNDAVSDNTWASVLQLNPVSAIGNLFGQKIWTAGNDGAGSGLDADTVDGLNATSFMRSDADNVVTGTLQMANIRRQQINLYGADTNFGIGTQTSTTYVRTGDSFAVYRRGGYSSAAGDPGVDGSAVSGQTLLYATTSLFQYLGQKVWHEGNDGAGSGLDADMLDGLQANVFQQKLENAQILEIGKNTGATAIALNFYAQNNPAFVSANITRSPGNTGELTINNAGSGAMRLQAGGALTFNGYTLWHSNNDGAGSGLDADLLDGFESSVFARVGQPFATTGRITLYAAGATESLVFKRNVNSLPTWNMRSGGPGADGTHLLMEFDAAGDATYETVGFRLRSDNSTLEVFGSKAWTAGNMGAGSGLDADLLDGQDSLYYVNLANAQGFLPAARVAGQEYVFGATRVFGGASMTSVTSPGSFNVGSTGGANLAFHSDGTIQASTTSIGGVAQPLKLNPLGGQVTINGNPAWHAGNDGAGSGLDADLLDGYHAAQFVLNNGTPVVLTAPVTINTLGMTNGDAMLSLGQHSSSTWNFVRRSHLAGDGVTTVYDLSIEQLNSAGQIVMNCGTGGNRPIVFTPSPSAASITLNGSPVLTTASIATYTDPKVNRAGDTMTGTLAGTNFLGVFTGRNSDSAAAPSFTWNNDLDSGMYRHAADRVGFATAATTRMILDGNAAAFQVPITSTGAITPGSDLRFKQDVRPLEDALSKVIRMDGVTYEMRADGSTSSGVIAQELQQVAPELVVERDGYLYVNYNGMAAYFIEAIKSLNADKDAVEERLARIEQQLSVLAAR